MGLVCLGERNTQKTIILQLQLQDERERERERVHCCKELTAKRGDFPIF